MSTILCIISVGTLLSGAVAFQPGPTPIPALALGRGRAGVAGACRMESSRGAVPVPRRAALALLALPVVSGAPHSSNAAKPKRGASNGKWAQHYDEFTDEELEGFTETDSGLQYKDVEEGNGASPAKGSAVYTHYAGYLLDSGNLFDSSYERGKPLNFQVGTGRVIKVSRSPARPNYGSLPL